MAQQGTPASRRVEGAAMRSTRTASVPPPPSTPPPVHHLTVGDYVQGKAACHFHRSRLRGVAHVLHDHDFHEVYWIEDGEGIEHVRDLSDPVVLHPGTVALVAATDAHSFTCTRSRGMTMANLAFPRGFWDELHARFFPEEPDAFGVTAPRRFHLGQSAVPELIALTVDLDRGERGPATAARCLLDVLALIRRHRGAGEGGAPAWLTSAVRSLEDPAVARIGVPALVARCGHTPAHVAREVRRWYGKTPTDLVNDARIAWAARRLASGEGTPLTLCLECGFTNLGHFYRLFRARMGDAPQRWMRRQHAILQPTSVW